MALYLMVHSEEKDKEIQSLADAALLTPAQTDSYFIRAQTMKLRNGLLALASFLSIITATANVYAAAAIHEFRLNNGMRIIVQEGDWNFPAKSYSQYKWFPEASFNDKSFYSYHDKLAFLNFKEDDVEIVIMRQPEFAEGYRTMFRICWDNFATAPTEATAQKVAKAK